MMLTAGYSGTPLEKKLGLKPGFVIRLLNRPDYYFDLFTQFPEILMPEEDPIVKKDFVHFFTKESRELQQVLPELKKEIKQKA